MRRRNLRGFSPTIGLKAAEELLEQARNGNLDVRADCAIAYHRHIISGSDEISPEARAGALLRAEEAWDIRSLRLGYETVHK